MLCRIRYVDLNRPGQRRGCGSNIDWCKFTRRQAPWFFSVQYDTRPYSNDTRLYSSGIVPLASNFIHQIIRYGKGGGSQSIWSWYPAQRCAIQARLCPAGQMMGKRTWRLDRVAIHIMLLTLVSISGLLWPVIKSCAPGLAQCTLLLR